MTGSDKAGRRDSGSAVTRRRNVVAGLLIGAFFLYLAFRRSDAGEMMEAIDRADLRVLLPSAALMLFSVAARALRWRYLLSPIKRIPMPDLFSITSIGLMANNVLPARMGEFVRAWLIGGRARISRSASFATIVVERVMDGVTVMGLFLFAIAVASPPLSPWLRRVVLIVLLVYAAAVVFLVLLRVKSGVALRIVDVFLGPLPDRAAVFLRRTIDSFIDGLAIVHDIGGLLLVFFLSLLVWIPNIVVIRLVIDSFGLDLPVSAPVILMGILSIGIAIPSAPGFAGTIQYCCVLGLAVYAVSRNVALGFSLVYHASVFLPLTGAGLLCLLREGISFGELRRSAARRE